MEHIVIGQGANKEPLMLLGALRSALAAGWLALGLSQGAWAQAGQLTYQQLSPPTLEAPPTAPEGKLSGAVVPKAYRLDLTIDPARERFSGHVEIDVLVNANTPFFFFHARALKFQRVVATMAGIEVPGRVEQKDETGTALAGFDKNLQGLVTLKFDYDAAFNDNPAGLFRVKVGKDWYAWSQFESIDARSAYPGFDEPGFKTPFTVTLRTRAGQVAVSNARELSKRVEGGLEVHRFEPTLPLPTYLVAMMTGPFAVAEGEVPPSPQRASPLPLRVITTQENAGRIQFALEASKGIVAHLEDYFGRPFPFPKLDQITSPIMPGAMENAGADLYADSILALDEGADVARKREFGMVVAHELSHQWFGDLVTPAWWDDIWLNESFANWMGYRIGDAWRPDLKIAAGALKDGFAAMDTDSLIVGRPIRQPIERNSEIDSAFDAITYGKGGQVVAMIAAFMGDIRFRDGVRRHMAAHQLGNATSTDFFGALAEAAGDPGIVPAMRSFTDQQGVPLLSFTRKGKQYAVSQSRYAPLGVIAPAAHWQVPICVRRGAARQCLLLANQSATFTLDGKGPLIPNAGGTGYYRFELPRSDWDALIAKADNLPGGEAQALADSLAASFRAGRASTAQLLALSAKLARNPDSRASDAASNLLGWLGASELIGDAAMPVYRDFTARLFRPALAKLGFDPRAGAYATENPDVSQSRVQAVHRLVRTSQDRELSRQLGDAASKFVGGDVAALDPAWFDEAFGVWLTHGGLAAAKTLAGQALASQDPAFRPAALDAIASTGDAAVTGWLLDEFKDARLRPSEQRAILQSVIGTKATRELGYAWLDRHLDQLMSRDSGIFSAMRLPQMLNGFCSAAWSDKFARDLRPRLARTPAALELERTIERVRNCGLLRDALAKRVTSEIFEAR